MIEFRQVWKQFGERVALQTFDLAVRNSETVALVGPNGAGKSTALRILAGTVRASGGTVEMDGPVAYLPQRLGMPGTTVVADLGALVATARGVPLEQVHNALMATGLEARLGAQLRDLSGGQRQRVMLALATVGNLGALLLDEPSISLDMEGAEDVRAAIAEARKHGAAVLFASHHLHDVAALADRIVLLVDGRVVAQGSLAELAAAAGVQYHAGLAEPPIERIYRVLVRRSRNLGPARAA